MNRWIDYSIEERKVMIQNVANSCNIDESAAEKDWWVTAILYAIFNTSISNYLLFKGGTSLSKGWNIINRFSEDIDLALDRTFFLNVKREDCAKCENNTQIHKLREKGQDYILNDLKKELSAKFTEMELPIVSLYDETELPNGDTVPHDKDPNVLYVTYPSLYSDPKSYAIPTVKIEISVLSMSEPYENKTISSLISQNCKKQGLDIDNAYTSTIKTVSPARTFLEKAFLLCEEYQKGTPRTRRMSRHFYDLEKLTHTKYAEDALKNSTLYKEIVAHREKFYHVGYVDYTKELPQSITILPPEELMSKFEADYKDLQENFIYSESLPFTDLMESIKKLQDRFRDINL